MDGMKERTSPAAMNGRHIENKCSSKMARKIQVLGVFRVPGSNVIASFTSNCQVQFVSRNYEGISIVPNPEIYWLQVFDLQYLPILYGFISALNIAITQLLGIVFF